MANYASLKAAIQDVIKTNGNNEITGALLQQSLLSMINSLGAEYQFVGVATPSTTPGTPDNNVAYIAGSGTFPNFGVTVPDGAVAIFTYNGTWAAQTLQVVGDDIPRMVVERTDLLFGHDYTNNRYINASTGEIQTLNTFFSFFEIPIPSGVTKLWPYCSYPSNTNCFRSIVFLNSSKNYISGVAGTIDYYQNGIAIPSNAAYFSVCFSKPDAATIPASYYMATQQGNPTSKYLENNVYVRYQNIVDAPTVPTRTSQLQNDSNFVTANDAATVTTIKTDIIDQTKRQNNRYLNPTTGEITTNNSFFAFLMLPIPDGITTLWPYNSSGSAIGYCCRSALFYNASQQFISGISGSQSYTQNGIPIPDNAKYVSVCFNWSTQTEPSTYYLATEQGAPVYKYLSNDVYVRYQNIINAPTIPTKTSDLQNDSGFVTADGVATVTTENTNIIDETKRIDNRFLNPSTGELATNSSFFTFQYLPIPSGVSKLWPYCSYPTSTNCARSVAFYDSAQQYISGISGTLSYYQNGIVVPQNAAFVSVCYSKPTQTTYPDSYYLATEQGAPVHKTLQTDIKVDYNSLINVPETRPRIRLYPKTKLPCISLQFDDCNLSGDQTVVEYMDSVGCVCDFAFMAAASYFGENSRASQYLAWNKRGYGIQNHSINGTVFNETNYNYSTALAAIMTARTRLENAGMVVNGFVCPSSQIADSFRPILALQGAYAFTTATSSSTANPRTADPCDLHRYSMQSHTIAEIEAFIDSAIANDQIITLCGHTADFGTTYSDLWNLAKVQTIVEYIIAKRDAGLVYFNNTDNCIKNYFGL